MIARSDTYMRSHGEPGEGTGKRCSIGSSASRRDASRPTQPASASVFRHDDPSWRLDDAGFDIIRRQEQSR
jgi:hypothetical protein